MKYVKYYAKTLRSDITQVIIQEESENMKTQVAFTVNPQIKKQADQIAKQLGMSLSTILSMCLAQVVYQHGLPFTAKVPVHQVQPKTNH